MHKHVDHVNALGSVLAVSLKDKSGAGKLIRCVILCTKLMLMATGYTSSVAVGLRDTLLFDRSKVQIHSRILGNVIYLMASLTTTQSQLVAVQDTFKQKLDAMS